MHNHLETLLASQRPPSPDPTPFSSKCTRGLRLHRGRPATPPNVKQPPRPTRPPSSRPSRKTDTKSFFPWQPNQTSFLRLGAEFSCSTTPNFIALYRGVFRFTSCFFDIRFGEFSCSLTPRTLLYKDEFSCCIIQIFLRCVLAF